MLASALQGASIGHNVDQQPTAAPRCNPLLRRSHRVNWHAARWIGERHRLAPTAPKAAAASPEPSHRAPHGGSFRRAGGSEPAAREAASNTPAPASLPVRHEQQQELPWREGVTDTSLVATSSTTGIHGGSRQGQGSSGRSTAGSAGGSRGVDQSTAFPLNPLGAVVDLSATVSKWLEGSGLGLRDWLLGVMHPSGAPQSAGAAASLPGAQAREDAGQRHEGRSGAPPAPAGAAADAAAGAYSPPSGGNNIVRMQYLWPPAALLPPRDLGPVAWEDVMDDGADGTGQGLASSVWEEEEEAVASRGSALAAVRRAEPVVLVPPPRRRTAAAVAAVADAAADSSSSADGSGALAGEGVVGAGAAAAAAGARAGLVGPMTPHDLTADIARAGDWRRLAVLLHLHGERFEPIHLGAAVVRLAKLYVRDPASMLLLPQQAQQQRAQHGGSGEAESEQEWAGRRADEAEVARPAPAAAAGAAEGQAELRPPQPHPDVLRLLRSLLALLPGLMPRMGPRQVSNMLWALGVLRPLLAMHQPPPHEHHLHPQQHPQQHTQQEQRPGQPGQQQLQWAERRHEADGTGADTPGALAEGEDLEGGAGQRGQHEEQQAWQLRARRAVRSGPGRPGRPAPLGQHHYPQSPLWMPPEAHLLMHKMRHFWHEAGPPSLALALWGMAKLGLRPGAVWVEEYTAASAPLLPHFSARELSHTMWALAALRLRPDAQWLAAARGAMAEAAAQQAARDAAARGEQPAAAAEAQRPRGAVAASAADAPRRGSSAASSISGGGGGGGGRVADASELTSQGLATLLWSCGVLSVKPDEASGRALLAGLQSRLEAEGPAAGAQALAMSLWGVARMGLRPPQGLLAAWQAAASGEVVAAAAGQSLSMMLWSLGSLRSAPKGAWVDAAAAALLARAQEGRLGAQALCNALHALAELDARVSPEWLAAFTAACAPLVGQVACGRQLGVLLNAVGRLGHPPAPAFLAAAEAPVVAALRVADPAELAGLARALRTLTDLAAAEAAEAAAAPGGAWQPGVSCVRVFQRRLLRVHQALDVAQTAQCLAALAALSRLYEGQAGQAGRPHAEADAGSSAGSSGEQERAEAEEGRAADEDGEAVEGAEPHRRPPRLPEHMRRLVVAMVHQVVTCPSLDCTSVYDVTTALQAAASLGYAPRGAPARRAIARSVGRVLAGARPEGRVLLQLLQALQGLGLRPPSGWLLQVAGGCGCRLRGMDGAEVERLLVVLQELHAASHAAPPAAAAPVVGASARRRAGGRRQRGATPAAPAAPQQHPVTALLASGQAQLPTASIQHLMQLAGAVVAALPQGDTQQLLPPGWLAAVQDAMCPRLGQPCVSAAALVELLACMACIGATHGSAGATPGAEWMQQWYGSTQRRMASLHPRHLSVAVRLQGRLGLRPPVQWLAAAGCALAAAAAARKLPAVEVLLLAAELQRLGLADAAMSLAASAAATSTASSSASSRPPHPITLSGTVALAASQLQHDLPSAAPQQQLAVLAALQGMAAAPGPVPLPLSGTAGALPAAGAVPVVAEGWVVGVLAMVHSVVTRRPVHHLLAALCPPAAPSARSGGPAGAAAAAPCGGQAGVDGAAGVVMLLVSMARLGHAPPHRWLAGVARHVAQHSGPGGAWRAQHAATAVVCLTVLGYVPGADVAERLQANLTPALRRAAPRSERDGQQPEAAPEEEVEEEEQEALPPGLVADLCWAWAAMRRRPGPAWWAGVERSLVTHGSLAAVPHSSLLRLPWAMAQLGYAPSPAWLRAYLPHMRDAVLAGMGAEGGSASGASAPEPLQRRDASGRAGGAAGGGGGSGGGLQLSTAGHRAEEVANLAWAVGTAVREGGPYPAGAGAPHPAAVLSDSGALQALLASSEQLLPSMSPGHLVLLVEGLARCSHALPQPWVERFCAQAGRQLQACSCSELCSLLYCLAYLHARVPHAWLAAALPRMVQLLPGLLLSHEEYRVSDLQWAVPHLDELAGCGGAAAQPFLAALVRQREIIAAMAAAGKIPGGGGDASDGESGAGGSGSPGRVRPRPLAGGGGAAVAVDPVVTMEEAAAAAGRSSPGRSSPGRSSPGRSSPGRSSPGRSSPGRAAVAGGSALRLRRVGGWSLGGLRARREAREGSRGVRATE